METKLCPFLVSEITLALRSLELTSICIMKSDLPEGIVTVCPEDGSLWIEQKIIKNLHGSLTKINAELSALAPDSPKRSSLLRQIELIVAIDSIAHFDYVPHADIKNRSWAIAHPLGAIL